jgi:hypothetical protein
MKTAVAPKLNNDKSFNGIHKTKQFNASFLNRSRVMKFLNELFFDDEEISMINQSRRSNKGLDRL